MNSIFILCGGYEWKYEMSMEKLAEFILKRVSKPKILDVWFAMEEERYKKYDDIFVEIYKNNQMLFERKIATQENFIEECEWADVINIHGGSSDLLFPIMQKYDLSILYENKIVIGSSAGAKFLSSYSPNWDGKGLREGSKILPLNVIVHYGDEKYLEGNANWSDVAMAMTKSPIGLSVILKEEDLRAFYKDGKEIILEDN